MAMLQPESGTAFPKDQSPKSQDPIARIAHLSDVHFGRISDQRVVEALVEEVNGEGFTLVAVSGDLTQRARTGQFEQARAFLARFEAPVLVVPGNHDVRAWWHNPYQRVFRHADRFHKHITPNETPSFSAPGLSVFGLDSSHGWTFMGGKIRARHLEAMDTFFDAEPPGGFRVLVLHHHLIVLKELGRTDLARHADRALASAQRAGVELVLCGHYHTSHVSPIETTRPTPEGPRSHRLVVASAGTATSSRGRGTNRNVNFYNWITVAADGFTVEERCFNPTTGRFATERTTPFTRKAGTPGKDG